MANPTTNYGFVLPTSSDLVTDLPADFDIALQGVDTRLKALQPGTTLGDLAYSSATANTNTRLPIGSNGVLEPTVMSLSSRAKQAWVRYHDAVESELSASGEFYDVRDVASKSADNAVRLAGLFEMLEGWGNTISERAFESASVIAAWHLQESRRFFGELALSPELQDAVRLECWLLEYAKGVDAVTTRYAQQYGPIRDKTRREAALKELEELDRLKVKQVGKSKVICINPELI